MSALHKSGFFIPISMRFSDYVCVGVCVAVYVRLESAKELNEKTALLEATIQHSSSKRFTVKSKKNNCSCLAAAKFIFQ